MAVKKVLKSEKKKVAPKMGKESKAIPSRVLRKSRSQQVLRRMFEMDEVVLVESGSRIYEAKVISQSKGRLYTKVDPLDGGVAVSVMTIRLSKK